MNKILLFTFLILFSFQSYGIERYRITVDLEEKNTNGKDWDPYNIGNYRKPEISISINNSEHLFRCKNSFVCDVEFLSSSKSFLLQIYELDTVNKNDTIGEGHCLIDESCKIGLATINIRLIVNPHRYGNCEPEATLLLTEKSVINFINNIGSKKSYYFTITECHFVKSNEFFTIDVDIVFIGKYQSYVNKSAIRLITNLDGTSTIHTVKSTNNALSDLNIILNIKNFFIEKDTNIIYAPRK